MGFFESIAPSFISGGASIVGGLMDAAAQRQRDRAAADLSREFARTGIQWKVEDAKKAGIHPLYAVGAPAISPTPASFPAELGGGRAMGEAGRQIGEAIASVPSAEARELDTLQKGLLRSQIGETDARRDYYISLAKPAVGSPPGQTIREVIPGQNVQAGSIPKEMQGIAEIKPREVISPKMNAPHVTALRESGFDEVTLGPGFFMQFPIGKGESWREVYNEMDPMEKWALWNVNKNVYGEQWIFDFVRYMELEGELPPNAYKPMGNQMFKPRYAPEEGFWENKARGLKERFDKWLAPDQYDPRSNWRQPHKRG